MTGAPPAYRNVTRRGFEAAALRAGINRPASGRSSAGTTCATPSRASASADGMDYLYLARVMGHARPSITKDVYGHLFDRVGRDAPELR